MSPQVSVAVSEQLAVSVRHLLVGPCGDEAGDAPVWSADEAGVEIAVAKSGKAQCQLAAQHLMGVQVIDV